VRRAAIVNPLRTPVGKFGGALRSVPVEDLAVTVVNALMGRTAVDPSRIDDVVFAQSYANSEVPCVGCDPATVGWGLVPAVWKIFGRTRMSFDDLALVEINVALTAQVLAVLVGWGWNDPDRLKVNGGGISLGHPIGATGMRIMTSMLYELGRSGGGFGLETMCIGGGQGMEGIFEVPTTGRTL
jgi:acetyl-CoA acetyltransferase